ncbi:hypothetical protein [uncultured Aliivibrio sp.]|uniref:hypothetical protein n=1 Tax=uncultured Aliivibrio sp. TaxID=873085 RepID=UPI00261F9C8E|nr:hypothetical protein [uncultured Aliivibrio sp.]
MNKRELRQLSEVIINEIENGKIKYILNICELLSAVAEYVAKARYTIFLNDNNSSHQERNQMISYVTACIRSEQSEVEYRKVIVTSHLVDEIFQSFQDKIENENTLMNLMDELRESLEIFIVKYESYKNGYTHYAMYELSFAALSLSNKIKEFERTIFLMSSMPISKINDNLCHLEVYLSNVDNLKSFGLKLEAVDFIYKELCFLLGESTSDNPIIIEYIESGSLWLKIAGHTLTATILTSVLNSASAYYVDNFTTTGKLQQLPASVTMVNELLKISEQLNEQGIDTSEITDNLNSATKKIANKLDILLGDQPVIEINDKVHDVGELFKDKLIEQSKINLLENKSADIKG